MNRRFVEDSKMPRIPDFGVHPCMSPTIYEGPCHLLSPSPLQYHRTSRNATIRKISTELANIASKLIRKSQGLRERYREELEKLGRPERYVLAVRISTLTQDQQEQISFAVQVQKEVIKTWTDKDYDDMGVDKLTADTELSFSTIILPLAELHTKTETRKLKVKERLEATQGEDWEDMVGDLMPLWPVEEFLRGLAVFSAKHTN